MIIMVMQTRLIITNDCNNDDDDDDVRGLTLMSRCDIKADERLNTRLSMPVKQVRGITNV